MWSNKASKIWISVVVFVCNDLVLSVVKASFHVTILVT
jgi:hypothetical protein